MKILFIGTGFFGSEVLKKLAQSDFKPDFLICSQDKPVGRKQQLCACPAKEVANHFNLSVAEFKTLKGKVSFFKKINPDLIIVADTNFILPEEILSIPKHGCLNLHPSLLPRHRGPSPVQFAILEGDRKTGITIILMDKEIDHGAIVSQKTVLLDDQQTYLKLRDDLAVLASKVLIEILPDWLEGKIQPQEQNHSKATYTKKLNKKDGQIHWDLSAQEISQQIRALNPWPGTYTFFKHKNALKRLKILKAKTKRSFKKQKPGTISCLDKKMTVSCSQGELILQRVQVEGKKEVSGEEFTNGYGQVERLINRK